MISDKIAVLLTEGYDVPEFYQKPKPEAKAILEKLCRSDWSKTKKMRRKGIEYLRELCDVDNRAVNKLFEEIYTTVVNAGGTIIESLNKQVENEQV